MKKILRLIWTKLTHEDLNLTAAALSYTTVLSFIPMIAILLSAMSHFDYFGSVTPKVQALIVENFSQTAGNEGVQLIEKGVRQIQRGKLGSFGAVILIIIATRLMLSLDRAVHRIWQVKNRRKTYQNILVYWLILLAIPFLLVAWLYSGKISQKIGFGFFPLNSGFTFIFFLLLIFQRYLPSFSVKFKSIFVGSLTSIVLLYLLTNGFTKLTTEVYRYSKVYGSLAAIPTFLLWIYLLWMSILIGISVSSMFAKTEDEDLTAESNKRSLADSIH